MSKLDESFYQIAVLLLGELSTQIDKMYSRGRLDRSQSIISRRLLPKISQTLRAECWRWTGPLWPRPSETESSTSGTDRCHPPSSSVERFSQEVTAADADSNDRQLSEMLLRHRDDYLPNRSSVFPL